MLRNGHYVPEAGYQLMSNVPVVAKTVKSRLLEIAKEAQTLATGLQSVAPADLSQSSAANTTVQYLFEMSDQLQAYAKECDLLIK